MLSIFYSFSFPRIDGVEILSAITDWAISPMNTQATYHM